MDAPRQFWMVAGVGPTQFRHGSRSSAEAEARRLAILNPRQHFFVDEELPF